MLQEKYKSGVKIRERVSRKDHANWQIPPGRPSVEEMISQSIADLVPELIPIRHSRMSASPFVFYRGTASIMARDLSYTPSSGVIVQACGDCHLMNFGGFVTPEGNIVLDINDFDETTPGAWEWDLKRLATSFALAARENELYQNDADDIVFELVSAYRDKLLEYTSMNLLEFWHFEFNFENIIRDSVSDKTKERLKKFLAHSDKIVNDGVLFKTGKNSAGDHSIKDQPPLITHPTDMDESLKLMGNFLDQYKKTLLPDSRILLDQYKLEDVAYKVVGVGSVGTRCYVVLFINENAEPLFIQVKEARPSVLVPYTAKNIYEHQGERVVQGQRLIQSASDIFLGWATDATGRHFYLRQLKDRKITVNIKSMEKKMLSIYAKYCGWILAKAHCKTGQGSLIYGYIGKNEIFPKAIMRFSKAYADQTEKDYNKFMNAIRSGKLQS